MALIVEDGTGLLNAEAYVSVAEADTYFSAYGSPAEWTAADTAGKEVALRLATQYLDSYYIRKWKGYRKKDTQALSWPRYDVYDQDGFLVSSDVVPKKLKEACFELALRSLREAGELQPDVELDGQNVASESVSVGAISQSFSYFASKGEGKKYPKVHSILKGFLEHTGSIERS